MRNREIYIDLGYQKDRNCTVSTTNTLNGLLNLISIPKNVKRTTFFSAYTTVFTQKVTIIFINTIVFVTKTTLHATKTTVFIQKIIDFTTNTIVFIIKTIGYIATTIVFTIKTTLNFKLFIRHIANLKGYNQYADWFRKQW